MAEHRLIDAYLTDLQRRLRRLDDADDLVAEAADHLLTTMERLVLTGVPPAEAERTALDRYGSARRVARAFRDEAAWQGAMATWATRQSGRLGVVSAVAFAGFFAGNALPVFGLCGVVAMVTGMCALLGVRARHWRLGLWGRLAWRTYLAGIVVGDRLATALHLPGLDNVIAGVAIGLAGVGLLRARILPAGAVVLAVFAPLTRALASTAGPRGLVNVAAVSGILGLGWIGWFMANEPLLADEPDGSDVAA